VRGSEVVGIEGASRDLAGRHPTPQTFGFCAPDVTTDSEFFEIFLSLVITRYVAKFRDFLSLFSFYIFKKHFHATWSTCFEGVNVRYFMWLSAYDLEIH